MFNVTRSTEVPSSLNAKTSYRGNDVYEALMRDFFGKCYLCESKDFKDIEIEHFDPHKGDENKKFDWNNLFLSCGRCNGIKGTVTEILNCTDPAIDVCAAIRHVFPNTPNAQGIQIEAVGDDPTTKRTAELISNIFNSDSTVRKSLTKIQIKKELCSIKIKLINNMMIYLDEEQPAASRDQAFQVLQAMVQRNHRYSAFIRWAVWEDETFRPVLEPYID